MIIFSHSTPAKSMLTSNPVLSHSKIHARVSTEILKNIFEMVICTLGGAMSSNLEMKMNDALFGLAPNFALPCTKKFDGKKLTFEFAKAGFSLSNSSSDWLRSSSNH